MEDIRKVALVGASGLIGSSIFAALVASGRYSITVLSGSSPQQDYAAIDSKLPIRFIKIDFESSESLQNALEGQDVLISALGKFALPMQPQLIDAAVSAKVKRIIPSEFGGDLKHPKVRTFPTYQPKVEVEKQLERCWTESGVSYTLIFNNVLLDWSLTYGLLMNPRERLIKLYDGGECLFSATRVETVGRAVLGVLDHYHETENRTVYIHDIATTQKELMEIALQITKDDGGKEWTIENEDTAAMLATSQSNIEKGVPIASPKVFYGFALRGAFGEGYGGHFKAVDNDLLGIGKMDSQQVHDLVRNIVTQNYD